MEEEKAPKPRHLQPGYKPSGLKEGTLDPSEETDNNRVR